MKKYFLNLATVMKKKKILHLAIILKRYFLHLATLTGKKLPPRPPRTLPLCWDSALMKIMMIMMMVKTMMIMMMMMTMMIMMMGKTMMIMMMMKTMMIREDP